MKAALFLALLGLFAVCNISAREYVIYAGAESSGFMFGKWYPSAITVESGDTLLFKSNDASIHNAVFLSNTSLSMQDIGQGYPPFVMDGTNFVYPPWFYGLGGTNPSFNGSTDISSKVLSKNQEYINMGAIQEWRVTISAAVGSYKFVCPFHFPVMLGTVTVVAAGGSTSTPTDVDNAAKAEIAADFAKINETIAHYNINANAISSVNNADGTKTWTVYAGMTNVTSGIMYTQFYPQKSFTITAGDTVRFIFSANQYDAHTVTINNTKPFETVLTNGKWQLLAEGIAPVGFNDVTKRATYTSGYLNSGVVIAALPDAQIDRYITFPNAGTYPYACYLHIPFGMTGVITVAPGSATTTPAPTTTNAAVAATAPVLLFSVLLVLAAMLL